MMSKYIGVVGSRRYPENQQEDVETLVFDLFSASLDTVVVSGGAKRVDTWAEQAALACGMSDISS